MPEQTNDKKIFSLLEVNRSIQRTISERYTSSFWVKGEINKLNFYKHSGHCYPELVEKQDNKIIAQMRGILWRDDFKRVNLQFLEVLKEPLKDGIKVLMLAKINFDPVYGISLQILDIDPAFTLGDLEREKQENLDRLKREGLFNLNRLLEMPLLPKRIAIISVESSKGYSDFMNVLENNQWGYRFFTLLFPALLQGDRAAQDILRQMDRVRAVAEHFDVVAIIRGGGGDVGLTCYNDYELAKAICEFPMPVLTGIGHSTNETVSELVAHVNAITPTKLAEYLIQVFHNFSNPIQDAQRLIIETAGRLLNDAKNSLQAETRLFRSVTGNALLQNQQAIRETAVQFRTATRVCLREAEVKLSQEKERTSNLPFSFLRNQQIGLENLSRNLEILRPENVLRRGYSITRLNGKALRDSNSVQPGTEIESQLYQGYVRSVVTSAPKSEKDE